MKSHLPATAGWLRRLFVRPAAPRRRKAVPLAVARLEVRDCPATNLIANPSVETAGASAGAPLAWQTNAYGGTTAAFSYPTAGLDGQRAVRVDVTARTGGDAKWFFDDVPVSPGQTYTFSDRYQSDVATSATVRYQLQDGTFLYTGYYPASASPTAVGTLTFDFTAPANAVSATVFHLISAKGFLLSDAFSLQAAGGSTADTVAPTVTVTAPAANATVAGAVTLSAAASDNVGVVGVKFLVDGQAVGTELTAAPFQLTLPVGTLAPGTHTVTAVARDAAGNTRTSAAVTFTLADAAATNLISNPSVETAGATGDPAGWTRNSWGTNTATFSPAVAGVDGSKAVRVELSGYSSGDAKWMFDSVPVTGGKTYTFSDAYRSSVSSKLVPRYTLADGTFAYDYLGTLNASSTWASSPLYSIKAPANAVALTVFHLIEGNGWLETDRYSLTAIGDAPADTTRPTVSVTAPAANASVSGTITLSAAASDNVGVVGVKFLVDGQAVGTEITAAPYQVSFNTAGLAAGNHTVTAVARDAAGNTTASAAVTFAVAAPPDTTAPTVSVTSPAANASVSGTVTLSATAGDDVGVVGVKFLVDGNLIGSEITAAPYQLSLDTTALAAGSHTVTAVARDAAGNSTTSAGVTLNVTPPADTTAPAVTVTSPAANASVSGTITLGASASDNVAVVGVQFLIDGKAVGTEISAAPYQLSLDTAPLAAGNHTVTAVARDAAGNSTTSAAVTFTVADTTRPTVAVTSPAANASVSGTITLGATASDDVGVVGVKFLVDGNPVGSEVTAGPFQVSLDTTSLAVGNHTVTAVARDAAGNTTTSAAVTFAVADVTAPVVTVTSPAAGATGSGTITLSASASDNVGVVGVRFLVDGQAVGSELTAAPYQVNFDTAGLAAGSHTVTAVARDAAGNSTTSATVTFAVAAPQNLIQNPSVETLGPTGTPVGWTPGSWGTNATSFSVSGAAADGSRAVRVELTSYTDGDAKWLFDDVSVTGGQSYTFTDAYRSNIPSKIGTRFKLADGTYSYGFVASLAATPSWTATRAYTITAPANAVALTVYHVIEAVGWLETDKYSLTAGAAGSGPALTRPLVSLTFDDGLTSQWQNAVPVLQQANLPASFYVITRANMGGAAWNEVQNPSLETAGTDGAPVGWNRVQTGVNDATFTYANTGSNGSRSARIDITSYTSGDAAWAFQDVVAQGVQDQDVRRYQVSHDYNSTVPTTVIARFTNHDGTTTDVNLGTLPATNGQWQTQTVTVTPPSANVDAVTILHRIGQAGTLLVDNFSVTPVSPYADPDYMTPAQIQALQADGFEVGSHTTRHPDLTTLSAAGVRAELAVSKGDLQALGIDPKTFVYPFGGFNGTIEQLVADTGYVGARSVQTGYNTGTADRFALMHREVHSDTTAADVQGWINDAIQSKSWLILTFHQVEAVPSDMYATTPQAFQQIVNVVAGAASSGSITPVTMAQGLAQL